MISRFLSKFIDLIAPRACAVCGCRLAESEEIICTACNLHLPRTEYEKVAYDNPLNRMFWTKIPIERAASLFFYHAHSASSNIIYSLKYRNHPEIGEFMGRMMAVEYRDDGFFEGIDMIVPVPLSRKRERQRGYNQSHEIALGVSAVTGIPINDKMVERTSFKGSQTHLGRWDRMENVDNSFCLKNADGLIGKHILLIDDVITTGATIIACAKAINVAENIKFSVLSIGFAKS